MHTYVNIVSPPPCNYNLMVTLKVPSRCKSILIIVDCKLVVFDISYIILDISIILIYVYKFDDD